MTTKKITNRNSSFRQYLRSLDFFSEPITFKFDGGSDSYETETGAIFTLIMAIIVLIYTGEKIINMARFDSDVSHFTSFDEFDDTHIFEMPSFAFGLSSYPPGSANDTDPDYGTVHLFTENWT